MPNIIWTDLDLNFIPNPVTGDISRLTGDNAVIQSVANLTELNHFEFPFHPSIGGNILKLLFEPLTPVTASAMAKEISNLIKNYEERATTYYVNCTANPQQNGYDVRVEFFINNSPIPVAITKFLERLG